MTDIVKFLTLFASQATVLYHDFDHVKLMSASP